MKYLCLLLFFYASLASATVRYVALPPSGDNARSCATSANIATPKATISDAVACLSAGDTLYIRAGTYPETLLNPPGGTSWNSPVTIAGYPGETVTIRPNSGAFRVFNFLSAASSYIILDNLHLDAVNCSADAVKIESTTGLGNSHHIRIQNSEIFNAGVSAGGGIVQGILVCDVCSGNEFINNNIHHNGDLSQAHFSHGMYITSADNLVEKSNIHDNAGYGIHLYGSANIHDNIIRSNRVYNHTHDNFGIIVSTGDNNFVYNNLVYNNLAGIQVDFGASNTKVWNNTIYNNHGPTGAGIYIGSASSTIAQNNILYNNDVNTISGGSGTVQDHNLLGTNPLFVSVSDFHLQAGSPAIDTGVCLGGVPTDFEDAARTAPCEIGAYIFGAVAVTNLFVAVQPSGGLSNVGLPSWTVQARDSAGNVVSSHTGAVSVLVGTNPSSAILSGTVNRFFTAGTVSWVGLSLNKIGTGYTYIASAPALPSVTTQSFTITGVPPNAPTDVRATPTP